MLPPPPPFARGECHAGGAHGRVRRRHHHYYHLSDKNIVDLRLLDGDSEKCSNNSKENNDDTTTCSVKQKTSFGGAAWSRCSSAQLQGNNQHFSDCDGDAVHIHKNLRHNSLTSSSVHSSKSLHNSRAVTSLFSSRGCEPPSKILDFLFIGGVTDATNAEFIRRENIVTILNVSREEYWSVERNAVIYPFPVDDTSDANIHKFFRPTYALLEHARRAFYSASQRGSAACPRVLVHCQRGRSRSATIVLAYLIRRNGWTVAEALQYVACRRPCVEPNLGFIEALRTYQEAMDTDERTRRRSSLCLAVRNLARTTASSLVHMFFEDNVGCVQGVVIHLSKANMSEKKNNNGNNNSNEHIATVTTPANNDDDDDDDKNNNNNKNSKGVSNDNSTIILPKSGHSIDDNNKDGNSVDESTLCLVFFSSAECVHLAKKLFIRQPELFKTLGLIDGKELRLTIPSKLIKQPVAKKEKKTVKNCKK